jgi:hypothetical protein
MSFVTVQLGQCGNQLGNNFFHVVGDELLAANACDSACFFRTREDGSFTPRAILVDMEPKVINSCFISKPTRRWLYERSNAIVQQSGAGVRLMFGTPAYTLYHDFQKAVHV